jgi:hypothetical protein
MSRDLLTSLFLFISQTSVRRPSPSSSRRGFRPTLTFDGLEGRVAPSAMTAPTGQSDPSNPPQVTPDYGGGFFTSTTGNYGNISLTPSDPTGGSGGTGGGGVIVTGPDNPTSPVVA